MRVGMAVIAGCGVVVSIPTCGNVAVLLTVDVKVVVLVSVNVTVAVVVLVNVVVGDRVNVMVGAANAFSVGVAHKIIDGVIDEIRSARTLARKPTAAVNCSHRGIRYRTG